MAGNNVYQSLLELIPKPLRNKYFIALLFFCGWLIFFDSHDVLTQWRLQRTVNKLEEDKDYYKSKIEEASKNAEEIEQNPEKIAREKYYMKKANEDVYIIEKNE